MELRVRNMMNFYSSNIFSGYASWEHIGYMLDAIKKLYPKKNILVDFTIDSEARIALKKDNSLEQTMQIIKEKEKLRTRKITGAKYLEWMLQWPLSKRES